VCACTQAGSREAWSDQETLLLLEGVEAFGEAWPSVAAHVGSKSQLQCALRFLQVTREHPADCWAAS
jgi:SWI/SNF related-matrix-associated actin-dependent regulator of chromatin subfamily C